jgi:hypothetical protein
VSGQYGSASDAGTECDFSPARHHSLSQSEDARQVNAVPVHRRRWTDPVEATVQPGAEVDHYGIWMPIDEGAHSVVEHLGAQSRLAHHAGLYAKACEVVVDLADHLVGQTVTEDRPGPPAVERSGVLGKKCGLFDWCQFCGCNPHDRERTPVFRLNG